MPIFGKKVGRGTVYAVIIEFEGKIVVVHGKMVDRKWQLAARFATKKEAEADLHPQTYQSELPEKATKIALQMAYEPRKNHDTSCLHDVFNQMSVDLA